MKTLSLVLALASFTTLTACGKDDPCAKLAKSICGDGKAPCDKVPAWIDSQMTGPNDEKLSDSDKGQACAMILGDKDALAGYGEAAKTELAKGK